MRGVDEAARHDARAARPFRHLKARVGGPPMRPSAPGSIERPPDFLARRARRDRRLGAPGRRAGRAGRTIRDRRGRPRRPAAPRRAPQPPARRVHLHLDDDADVAVRREHVGQRRHADALPAKRVIEAAPEVVAGVDARQLGRAERGDAAPGVRRSRSSVASWCTTTTPSRERWTSSSRPSAPSARPRRTPRSCSPGASALPPRCAKTSGRDEAKNGMPRRQPRATSSDRIDPWRPQFQTLGDLSAGAPAHAAGEAGNPRQPDAQAAGRRRALPRHRRLRRHGRAAARQRDPVAAQLHPARPARPGEEPHPARADRSARRADSGGARLRDPRRPAGAALRARAARASRAKATTCRSPGCRATRATSRSSRRPT